MLAPIIQRTRSSHSVSRLIKHGFLLLLNLSLLTSTLAAQKDSDTPVLERGKSIERGLAGGKAHSYRITLAAQQFLHVVVEQKGIDVVVALFGPDGKKVKEVDSPNGTEGPEPISVVTEAAGNYRLEVRALDAKAAAGRYQAKMEEVRAATKEDLNRIAAEQMFAEAEQLRGEGGAESLRKAVDKYQEALPAWRAVNDRAREAVTLRHIGSVYDSLGEKQKALDFYSQALPLSRAIGDRSGEAIALNNIGYTYDSLGEKQKALDYYTHALSLLRAVGDRGREATALNNIGRVYNSLGEKQKALDFYLQALPLTRAVGDRDGEARRLNNIGSVYDDLGEKQKALDFYTQALSICRAVGDRGCEATALNNMGHVYSSLGEKQKALDYYMQSLPLLRAVGDRGNEASTLGNIGMIYFSLDDKQKALDFNLQALPLTRAVGDRQDEAIRLGNIGVIYSSLGDKQKAFNYYAHSLRFAQAIEDHQQEVIALYNIAHLEHDRDNLREARATIESALNIIESLRTKIVSPELRASYFATVQDDYELYIDTLMRLHKQRPSAGYDGAALEASESRRARSLLELLAEAGTDIRQGIEPKLVERERSLQQQLNARAQQRIQLLSGTHTKEQASAIAKEIEALTTEFQQVEAQIRQTSPRYAALTQPEPLKLQAIQKELDPDTLLLEYSLGAERSYLWLVSPSRIESFELPARGVIETAARQFYELLNKPNDIYGVAGQKQPVGATQPDAQQKEMFETASRLSHLLLGQVAPHLSRKRLVIVADGALQYVPFAALPDAASSSSNGGEFQPLIVRHEIVNLPSISVLPMLRSEMAVRKPAAKSVVILADPVFDAGDERVKKNSAEKKAHPKKALPVALGNNRFPRLRGTRNEAEGILTLVSADKARRAFDFQASRTFISDKELSQYRYVHFATHGLLDSTYPELSAIVLSLVDENGEAENGYLRLHEVYNLNLPADLVVLSGCQTALGKEIQGEGLVGLTRGFMYAGAARVVASLWRADDEATAELMVRFYRGVIKEGRTPAAALSAAQIEMIRQPRWRAPHYWAAFVLQGEWR